MGDRRRSSAFDRPPGNVFVVADDGGSPLADVSQRPTPVVTSVEIDRGGPSESTETTDDH